MEPDPVLVSTRRALHGVAELVLAGPQYAASAEIALRVVPGGFATTAGPQVRVDGDHVVRGDARVAVTGATPRQLAEALGLEARRLDDVYADDAGVGLDDVLTLDSAAARLLSVAWSTGDTALRRLDPSHEPVLWPEHFDVAIRVDGVNYGVSPGDALHTEPYAYVGPDTVPAGDAFWNSPFGAATPVRAMGGATGVRDFFADAQQRLLALRPPT
jgi:hypothetical protein